MTTTDNYTHGETITTSTGKM